jgi:hypothetical protein
VCGIREHLIDQMIGEFQESTPYTPVSRLRHLQATYIIAQQRRTGLHCLAGDTPTFNADFVLRYSKASRRERMITNNMPLSTPLISHNVWMSGEDRITSAYRTISPFFLHVLGAYRRLRQRPAARLAPEGEGRYADFSLAMSISRVGFCTPGTGLASYR